MKRVKTYAEKKESVDPISGLKIISWTKKCPICGKLYETFSRSQKFCSDSCCKKAQVKRRKQKKEYDATKEVVRLSSRSHSLANEVVRQYVNLGLIEYKCSCGCTEGLQIHHCNLNWLDNRIENLQVVCPKCHAEIHSKLEVELKAQGRSIDELYSDEFKPILSVLNKNLR